MLTLAVSQQNWKKKPGKLREKQSLLGEEGRGHNKQRRRTTSSPQQRVFPKRSLFAFNTNLDYVKKANLRELSPLEEISPMLHSLAADCFKKGVQKEVAICGKERRLRLSKMRFDRQTAGGQAGNTAQQAAAGIMAFRKDQLFGVFTRPDGGENWPENYHGKSVWPRETVFLLELLEKTGERRLAEQLLLSNLDHQKNEGAVFYCHELFDSALRPLKNPAQAWSSWVDPYL